MVIPNPVRCPLCGEDSLYKIPDRPHYVCVECRAQREYANGAWAWWLPNHATVDGEEAMQRRGIIPDGWGP